MVQTKIFLGGATGYTGRHFVKICDPVGAVREQGTNPDPVGAVREPPLQGSEPPRLVSWMRRSSGSAEPACGDVVRADPNEIDLLADAMQGCTAVVSLIGTTRAQFDEQTNYETVDIGTTRSLVQAARQTGDNPRFVLLSSVGAGRPAGAYLKAKQRAEHIVRTSGLPYVIVRPSFILGPGRKVAMPSRLLPAKVPPFASYRGIYAAELARILYFAATADEAEFDDLGLVWEGDLVWKALERFSSGFAGVSLP